MTSRTCFKQLEIRRQARCSGAWLVYVGLAVLMAARFARAEAKYPTQSPRLVSFCLEADHRQRMATVECVHRHGVDYGSLSGLVRQLGGGCNVLRTRLKVDFAGGTALIGMNDTQVNASLRSFTLRHPILSHEKDALIALADVTPFFANAFRAKVVQDTPKTGPAGPTAARHSTETVSVQALPDPQNAIVQKPAVAQTAEVPGREHAPRSGAGPDASTRPPHVVAVVIIDPGHGGNDAGCRGPGELSEKDLTLALARRLAPLVQSTLEAKVLLTRAGDDDMTLEERAGFANGNDGDLLISIHAGASFSSTARGFELFHPAYRHTPPEEGGHGRPRWSAGVQANYADPSRELAEAVAAGLAAETETLARGVHEVGCRLLKDASMPGILVEVGFLTNPAEGALLETEAYQAKIARGIVAGLKAYVAPQAQGRAIP